MQLSYWVTTDSPFREQSRMRCFFASPTHDEALARLGFLVDSGHTLGILSGYEGTGRTTVLEVFARGMRQQGHMVCSINLVGLENRGFLWTLAAGLGCNPRANDDMFTLGCRIDDRLRENELTGRTTVLLLDDADQAAHDVLIQVLRLLKTHLRGIRVILAIESTRMARLGTDLLHLSHLRIRLEPWNEDDIRKYLATSLLQVGCERSIFEDSAMQRLRELTDGIPRWVGHLAELALLAAASQGRDSVDRHLIEDVYQELSASFEEDLQDGAY
jgi:general secretion pathway protein A